MQQETVNVFIAYARKDEEIEELAINKFLDKNNFF